MVALAGARPRNELIVAAVELVLAAAAAGPDDLGGVVATRGPGSFTGLRVTLATAQALCLARSLPGHAFPSLLVQAERTLEQECLAVQPARRGVVYAQTFCRAEGRMRPVGDVNLMETTALARQTLPVAAPDGLSLPDRTPCARVAAAGSEALLRLYASLADPDPTTLVPLYVEPPAITPPTRTASPWQPSPTGS